MTPEQKAAVERLREATAGRTWYPGMTVDYAVVAELYLAEHPADDDEPVTENWLRSIGFSGDMHRYGPGMWLGRIRVDHTGVWCWQSGPWPFGQIETRRDVRQLCRALGVPLNEGTAEQGAKN